MKRELRSGAPSTAGPVDRAQHGSSSRRPLRVESASLAGWLLLLTYASARRAKARECPVVRDVEGGEVEHPQGIKTLIPPTRNGALKVGKKSKEPQKSAQTAAPRRLSSLVCIPQHGTKKSYSAH